MALKSLRDANQKIVAIVTLSTLAAGCVFAFAVGQLHLFDRGYTMSGEFTDVAGLKKGQDVRVAGVKAGRVTGVEPDFRTGKVIVTWHVDAGIDLGPQTRADIATTTLLGGRYLKLSGPVARPYMADVPESRRRIRCRAPPSRSPSPTRSTARRTSSASSTRRAWTSCSPRSTGSSRRARRSSSAS